MAASTTPDRRRYRKVYTRLWTNPEFQALNDSQKLMTLYLLSGPQTNRIGLFRLSVGEAAEDLGTSIADARSRVLQVCRAFGWEFDSAAKVVWIPSWWTFNQPAEKANNFKGALTDLNDVPRTSLIGKFCRNFVGIPHALHELLAPWASLSNSVPDSVPNSVPNTVATQEQEQELEQELEQEQETDSSEPRGGSQPAPSPTFMEFPTVGAEGTVYALTEAQVAEWQELFPTIDVRAECRAALAWLKANPGRRKTVRGMPKFLVSWFTRTVNRGGGVRSAQARPVTTQTPRAQARMSQILNPGRPS